MLPGATSRAKARPITKEAKGTKAKDTRATKREALKEEDTKEEDTKEEDTKMQDTKRGRGKGLTMEESQDTKEDGRAQEVRAALSRCPSGTATSAEAEGTLLRTAPKPLTR